jgi:hypothetical protein
MYACSAKPVVICHCVFVLRFVAARLCSARQFWGCTYLVVNSPLASTE